MKSWKFKLIFIVVAVFVFACGQNKTVNVNQANNAIVVSNNDTNTKPSATMADELTEARKNYSELCVKCHKEGGIGGVSEIDGKRIKAPNFTSDRMKKDEDADWIDAIKNGIADEGMPAYKDRLNDQQIKDLVKMIRRDFQKQ